MSQGRNGEPWTGLWGPRGSYAERQRKATSFEEKAENGLPGGILPNLGLNSSMFVISGLVPGFLSWLKELSHLEGRPLPTWGGVTAGTVLA